MSSLIFLLLLIAGSARCSSSERKNYEEYSFIDILPMKDQDVSLLRRMMLNGRHDEIDFWIEPRRAGEPCTLMVKKSILDDEVIPSLMGADVPFLLKDYDLHGSVGSGGSEQSSDSDECRSFCKLLTGVVLICTLWTNMHGRTAIEVNFDEIQRIGSSPGNQSINLDNFNDLKTIYSWLDTLPSKCPKGFSCQVYNIGHTHLAVPITALKISKPGATNRKSWYLDATTHAREWITTGTILKIINHLITVADGNAKLLLEKYDWHFVPVVNPDGYDYSWKKERTWRKNRRSFGTCVGVDLNRNFASSNWGKEGSSSSKCSQTYMGPAAGTEKETEAISRELMRLQKTAVVLFSLHSFGNMYLLPYGNTINSHGKKCQRTSDHDEIMVAVHAAANATEAAYNTIWTRGNACEVIYPTTGSTDDYAKEKAGIKYCIVPELRGPGFIVPPSQIHPSFVEIFDGIVALEKYLKP